MSNDTTKMLLGIDDEHLIIENGKIGDDGVIRLNGSLNYSPKACHNCGVINDHQIIGYGWRKTTIRFAKTLGSTVILCLNRRNFHCKACHTNFLAQTNAVPKLPIQIRPQQCLENDDGFAQTHADELPSDSSWSQLCALNGLNQHFYPKFSHGRS
uniref:transposase family protein n=1 Tax=Lentilactobacillus buchneri TaxID=1581 RepID=UPI001CDC279F|nr:transposase family protein [Lentilactobacillus buchneri]